MNIVVQIGNSNNKLSQAAWSDFIRAIEGVAHVNRCLTHFSGGSNPKSEYQNYCFIWEIRNGNKIGPLRKDLAQIAKKFKQDSIAVIRGDVEFVDGG